MNQPSTGTTAATPKIVDEQQSHAAFMSALTTEHFVLQTAANATVSDAAARSSLYVVSLSSSLVALGFASQSRNVFPPFVSIVLPGIFVLGVFTVMRLVDTARENTGHVGGRGLRGSFDRHVCRLRALAFSRL